METVYMMECSSCCGIFKITVVREPEDGSMGDEERPLYCPNCSSAEEYDEEKNGQQS